MYADSQGSEGWKLLKPPATLKLHKGLGAWKQNDKKGTERRYIFFCFLVHLTLRGDQEKGTNSNSAQFNSEVVCLFVCFQDFRQVRGGAEQK